MHVFHSGEDHDAVGESTLNQEVKSVPVRHTTCKYSTPNTETNVPETKTGIIYLLLLSVVEAGPHNNSFNGSFTFFLV